MSRLAALKEFAFMQVLKENGFRVPEPIANSRHTIVMELIDAFPLRQISEVPDPAGLYAELINMILRLAEHGLIHGDFNEFNILIREEKEREAYPSPSNNNLNPAPTFDSKLTPMLIDFPQMVSIDHANAEMYFDRDVKCIKTFFSRRFHFTSDEPGPFIADARKRLGKHRGKRLDVEVEASGFSKKMAKDLEKYMQEIGVDGDGGEDREDEEALEDGDDARKETEEEVGEPNNASEGPNGSESMQYLKEEGKLPSTGEDQSVPTLGVSCLSLGNT